MARCQCAGSSCSCQIQGGRAITVTGSGTVNSPYRIEGGAVYMSLNSNDYESGFINLPVVEDRAVINIYARSDITITLPTGVSGAQIDITVHHVKDPGTAQWNVTINVGTGSLFPGSTFPGPDQKYPSWYRCVSADDVSWFVQGYIATTAP